MAVDTNLASLFEKLKLEDPYVPPRPWESIISESGGISSSYSANTNRSSHVQFSTSAVSESSLVRLTLDALQGVESALISIQKLSALFCFDSADRSFHHIPSLLTRTSSTLALGNLLKSIGRFGCIIFLLHKFVDHFTCLTPDGNSDEDEVQKYDANDGVGRRMSNHTLVNQAFAVSVAKILDGYTSALNTLYASVNFRRCLKSKGGSFFTSVGHGEITLLEAYLHSAGLRTQLDVLGNICNMSDIALRYSELSLEEISAKAFLEFNNFPRSGALHTFLYTQLKMADPAHCALLKFLFLRSWEPYCGFIRAWIFEGRIADPFKEFIVEIVKEQPDHEPGNTGMSNDFPLASVRVRQGVLPLFLEDCLLPLFRAGQQLQIITKLLEFCDTFGPFNGIHEELLPGINGFSSEFPSFRSSLLFEKGTIETMVVSRNSYYQRMLEKVHNVFTKMEFRFREGMQPRYANHARNLASPVLFSTSDNLDAYSNDTRGQTLVHDTIEAEISIDDDFSGTEDLLESSEASSEENSEEQSDFDLPSNTPGTDVVLEPDYLSALSLIDDDLLQKQKFPLDEISCSAEYVSCKSCRRMEISSTDVSNSERAACDSSLPYRSGEQSTLQDLDNRITNSCHNTCWLSDCFPGNLLNIDRRSSQSTWSDEVEIEPEVGNCKFGVQLPDNVDSSGSVLPRNPSLPEAYEKDQHPYRACTFLSSKSLPSWKMKHNSDFLSMNPVLARSSLVNPKREPEQMCSRDSRQSFPFFNFTSIRDPCEVYIEKFAANSRDQLGAGVSVLTGTAATAAALTSRQHNLKDHSDKNLEKKAELSHTCSPVGSEAHIQKITSLENAAGGSGWERLLANSSKIANTTARFPKTSLVTVLEMPLDHIIKKCLLEEILLQYKYLSKLTIQLLDKAFSLHEHLLALRRYHFMELTDWAYLFVSSLQHHKWYTVEAEKRISEIQGILELSVQRSSCEGDPYKDRLFVYVKGSMTNISVSGRGTFYGIHSFDCLGLGYRVDWPLSIILSPGALNMYSDIFSFLIQVKLAAFSLSDIWRSLKDLSQLDKKNQHFAFDNAEPKQLSILIETRHQLNHFVCTLQQYVQSQLSHVSWCRFMHSLKDKVKDMMDLHSAHMAYLDDSVHICFLSEETQHIASIIRSILQSAVDFRSCLSGDISQVLHIRKTFSENIKELYLCYLKSPRHVEFGLSCFWEHLNYNDHYSEVIGKQMGHKVFLV